MSNELNKSINNFIYNPEGYKLDSAGLFTKVLPPEIYNQDGFFPEFSGAVSVLGVILEDETKRSIHDASSHHLYDTNKIMPEKIQGILRISITPENMRSALLSQNNMSREGKDGWKNLLAQADKAKNKGKPGSSNFKQLRAGLAKGNGGRDLT